MVPDPLPEEPHEPPQVAAGSSPHPAAEAHSGLAETSIRVSVNLLDQLMNLAGELVLSRNQLLQTISSGAVMRPRRSASASTW